MSEMFLDAGQLRHRVTIQQNNPTYDVANQDQPTWTSWLTRWAKIESAQGGQFIQGQQLRNNCTHVVTIRYLAGVAPKRNRLTYQGRVFNILSVFVSEERKIDTIIYCQEVLQ